MKLLNAIKISVATSASLLLYLFADWYWLERLTTELSVMWLQGFTTATADGNIIMTSRPVAVTRDCTAILYIMLIVVACLIGIRHKVWKVAAAAAAVPLIYFTNVGRIVAVVLLVNTGLDLALVHSAITSTLLGLLVYSGFRFRGRLFS